jgi:hypothetical protein
MAKIKTILTCSNIAPLENLSKEIESNSLKIGILADNGSGKTFISRMFRLTEHIDLKDEGKSTNKLITFKRTNVNNDYQKIILMKILAIVYSDNIMHPAEKEIIDTIVDT